MKANGTWRFTMLAVVGASLLLIGIAIVTYHLLKQEQERGIDQRAIGEIAARATNLSHMARVRLAELEVMAATETLQTGTLAEKLAYLRSEQERLAPSYYRIGVTNTDGVMSLSDGNRVDASRQKGFAEAMAGESVITAPVRDGVHPEDYIILARVPYYDKSGQIRGVLGSSFRVERLLTPRTSDVKGAQRQRFLQDESGLVLTLGEDGRAVEVTDFPLAFEEQRAVSVFSSAPLPGIAKYVWAGKQSVFLYATVPGTSWRIVEVVGKDVLYAHNDKLLTRILLVFGLMELLLLVVVIAYHGGFTSHLRALSTRLTRMNFAARHDYLTSLPNRMNLKERLESLMEIGPRGEQTSIGLALLDLDRFKNINDTLGHSAGDEGIIQAASLLKSELRPGQQLFRLGGDEFVLLLEQTSIVNGVREVERLQRTLRRPFRIHSVDFEMSGSAGISFYPQHAASGSELLRNADLAMYEAKQRGGNCCVCYTSAMGEKRSQRVRMEHLLRRAIGAEELFLVYQPIAPLQDSRGMYAECLLRWQSKELGTVGPDEFIPIAEETTLILEIGEWVLGTACRQMAEWQAEGLAIERLSINISAIQLEHPDFVDRLQQIVVETGCNPQLLMLEVTESAVVRRLAQASHTLAALSELGFRIALDDFGTGYSSLSALHQLNIDVLKIDRSFIARLGGAAKDQAMLGVILSIADQLGIDAVAEGVETEVQLDTLKELACRYVQGYLLSRPLTAAQLAQYARTSSA